MGLLISNDDFYNQRDDRTNRYLNSNVTFQNGKVLVKVAPGKNDTYNIQLMLLAACNTLSRFCRNITVLAQNVPLHHNLCDDQVLLLDQLKSTMQNADPFGNFFFAQDPAELSAGDWDCVLHIGAINKSDSQKGLINIDGDGWIACMGDGLKNFDLPMTNQLNPVGPGLAAALGVAEVFKRLIGQPNNLTATCFSAFNLEESNNPETLANPPLPSPMDLGNCLMVGVGMVGSSALYFIKKTGIKMNLTLVDDDVVKIVNLNRSPIFGVKDCGTHKVSVGAAYLQKSGINVTSIPEKFAIGNVSQFDFILPLANEDGIRNKLQNALPPLSLHAATAPGWGVTLYRHIPFTDNCLQCYPAEERKKANLACAEEEIQILAERVDAALPFLPMIAGVFLVGEMMKLQYRELYPNVPNTVSIELGERLWVNPFHRNKTQNDCLCKQDVIEEIHRARIKSSKYFYLSKG
ncbi:ThiF family adenylyltransferase [Paenibacillus aurantius]|uniref:ThiF family adenylyltransferase n=1 Tax=Paenibacillus aurantius TaxID=2918900 RepID=A0AA96LAI7_9BACL|nr:ThiF family adenylyltransferase [Paenibacillus aurantius]WNQ09645.1 ThiF family adenylyltransferase [Paenibacillus aurantius]